MTYCLTVIDSCSDPYYRYRCLDRIRHDLRPEIAISDIAQSRYYTSVQGATEYRKWVSAVETLSQTVPNVDEYDDDRDYRKVEQAISLFRAMDGRKRNISCLSACFSPITCPIWTIYDLFVCCCCKCNHYLFPVCSKNKCLLYCCSVIYPYHSCISFPSHYYLLPPERHVMSDALKVRTTAQKADDYAKLIQEQERKGKARIRSTQQAGRRKPQTCSR